MDISVVRATDAERYLNLDRLVWFEESWTASLDEKLMGVPEDQRFAAEVVSRFLLFLEQAALDHGLRRDAGMIGAGHPQRVVTLHSLPANEDVLQRVIERVA